MRINPYIQFQPFKVALADRIIEIDGDQRPMSSWLEEFNAIRRGFNGPDFRPYGLDEITRDDLATEFAFEAYCGWNGIDTIDL